MSDQKNTVRFIIHPTSNWKKYWMHNHPEAKNWEKEAHEETLFIIVHQVYELWFKQVLHEMESVMKLFQTNNVDEKNIDIAVSRLERVNEIVKLMIQQVRVIETMTPLDF